MIGGWMTNRCEEHGTKLDAAGYCDLCTEAASDDLVAAIFASRQRRAECPVCVGTGRIADDIECPRCDWRNEIHQHAEYLDVVHL